MKFGMRVPSPKRSIKAATTGRVKRAVKRSVSPVYGSKGIGLVANPKRSVKSAIYKRTTFSIFDLFKRK